MDPNACLKEMLTLANRLADSGARSGPVDESDCQRLGELVLALDGWLEKGGFLPDRWFRKEGNL